MDINTEVSASITSLTTTTTTSAYTTLTLCPQNNLSLHFVIVYIKLRQILTNFENPFAGTFCRQFAIR